MNLLKAYAESHTALNTAYQAASARSNKLHIEIRPDGGEGLDIQCHSSRIQLTEEGARWLYAQLGRILGLDEDASKPLGPIGPPDTWGS